MAARASGRLLGGYLFRHVRTSSPLRRTGPRGGVQPLLVLAGGYEPCRLDLALTRIGKRDRRRPVTETQAGHGADLVDSCSAVSPLPRSRDLRSPLAGYGSDITQTKFGVRTRALTPKASNASLVVSR